MLIRVDPSTFEGRIGDTVHIIAKARNNGGFEFATFIYAGLDLDAETINGRPGCTFVVLAGRNVLTCTVTFGGGANAAYDFFEVDDNGTEFDLQESLTPDFGAVIQFRIDGVPMAALAGAPGPVIAAKKAAKKKTAAKKKAKKRAVKKTAKKKIAKKAPRKRAGRKKASSKSATGRGSRGRKSSRKSAGRRASARKGSLLKAKRPKRARNAARRVKPTSRRRASRVGTRRRK